MMSFRDLLPLTTRRYRYERYDQCLEILNQECDRLEREEDALGCTYSPYFIMDIDERSFRECFVNSEDNLLTLSWDIYDHVFQSALLRMQSRPHAVAVGTFNNIFSAWARRVAEPHLLSINASNVRGQTRSKQSDISWSPRDMPNGRSHKWPTLVGEVAWSEPRTKLQKDIEFWLDDPNSDVNVAITISILRRKIIVESWERRHNKPPAPSQRIEILRNPRPGRPRVNGQLEINFSAVFLRPKRAGESDFVLTATDMDELAADIWTYQYLN
ncbi:hypothetical protein N7457_002125 [Penicillium paradoxum]|uniref:uncharacterized protein n=1 Tax=Penicillium paradoxum TaxID=176176 RepID=UPI0025472D12|nr:uncharacterized protein N7457_002125 [Penicillium paradoxum]KAJ5787135.1 hypothetical protein N7457_002125 [Penicillium paradoxum]